MAIIFLIVCIIFYLISLVTGFTYEEVNVIFYFFLLPFSYCAILDIIFRFKFFRITFAILTIIFFNTIDFYYFSAFMFDYSRDYLESFPTGYVDSSVIVCVLIPALIYLALIPFVVRVSQVDLDCESTLF